VLCRDRLAWLGHVQVRHDERAGIDRIGLRKLGERQSLLIGVQGAAPPRPGVGGDLGQVQRHQADQHRRDCTTPAETLRLHGLD
jgi:hypothetical protein